MASPEIFPFLPKRVKKFGEVELAQAFHRHELKIIFCREVRQSALFPAWSVFVAWLSDMRLVRIDIQDPDPKAPIEMEKFPKLVIRGDGNHVCQIAFRV